MSVFRSSRPIEWSEEHTLRCVEHDDVLLSLCLPAIGILRCVQCQQHSTACGTSTDSAANTRATGVCVLLIHKPNKNNHNTRTSRTSLCTTVAAQPSTYRTYRNRTSMTVDGTSAMKTGTPRTGGSPEGSSCRVRDKGGPQMDFQIAQPAGVPLNPYGRQQRAGETSLQPLPLLPAGV